MTRLIRFFRPFKNFVRLWGLGDKTHSIFFCFVGLWGLGDKTHSIFLTVLDFGVWVRSLIRLFQILFRLWGLGDKIHKTFLELCLT